jgi:hypothetical protein
LRSGSLVIICIIITAILVTAVIVLEITGHTESHMSMLFGMGLGMSTSPIMMTVIKKLKSQRKINKILREILQMRKQEKMEIQ